MPDVLINRELLELSLNGDEQQQAKARNKLRTTLAQQGEAVEVATYRVRLPSEPELGHWFDEHAEEEPQTCWYEPLMTVAQHQRILAASVPAGCKVVPVGLLERLAGNSCDPDCCIAYWRAELRAFLNGGEA